MAKITADSAIYLRDQGPDAATSMTAKRPDDPGTALPDMLEYGGSLGVCGIDPQSPVLNGGVFSNYDTVFYHGNMAMENAGGGDPDVIFETDNPNGHYIVLSGAAPGYTNDAWINCPSASYDSKQGG